MPNINALDVGGLSCDLKDENARVMAESINGYTYPPFIRGAYVATDGETADILHLTSHADWWCVIDACTPGTEYLIDGIGGATGRLWAFLDTNGNVLNQTTTSSSFVCLNGNNTHGYLVPIVAPSNAAYFVFNNHISVYHDPRCLRKTNASITAEQIFNPESYPAIDVMKATYEDSTSAKFVIDNFIKANIVYPQISGDPTRYTGFDTSVTTRACILDTIDLSKYLKRLARIIIPDGYTYAMHWYDTPAGDTSAESFARSFHTTEYVFVHSSFCRIVLAKTDDTQNVDDNLSVTLVFTNDYPAVSGNYANIVANDLSLFSATGIVYPTAYSHVTASDRAVTDLIKIPKSNPYNNYAYDPFKYLICACVSDGEWTFRAVSLTFFDENLEITSYEQDISDAVPVDRDATYVIVSFYKSDKEHYVGFSNNDDLPAPLRYKPEIPAYNIPTYSDSIHNSDGAKTNLLKVALTYAYENENFGYGNTHTAYQADCSKVLSDGVVGGTSNPVYDGYKYQIDCSAFTRLVLQNVTPKNSRYYSNENYSPRTGYKFNSKVEYDTEYGRLTANKIAKYAYDNGYMFQVLPDCSNLEVGDLVFISNQDAQFNFFENIGHAAFVTDVWDRDDHVGRFRALEASSSTEYVIVERLYTKSAGDNKIFAARFPMPYVAMDLSNMVSSFQATTTPISLSTNEEADIATASLSRSIEKDEVYTVVIDADIPDNTYLVCYYADERYYFGAVGASLKVNADGIHTFHEITFKNMNFSGVDMSQIKVSVKASASASGTAVVRGIKVINGYYTPSVFETFNGTTIATISSQEIEDILSSIE